MNKHRIGAIVAAGALALNFAGTAFAADLHQDLPITGTDFENTEVGCDEGWHFVHTDTDGSYLPATLTVKFEGAGEITVDGYSNGNGKAIVMYDVHVDADDTLIEASDSINGVGMLNLSHVCVPEETTTTTTTDVETTTTDVQTTTTDVETTTTDVETTTTDVETTTDSTTTTTSSVETETTAPEGSVEELTPPSTDAVAPTSTSAVSTGLLLVLAGLLSFGLVLAPAAARKRR